MLLRAVAVVSVVALGATTVWAQNLEAIKQRREVMKAMANAGTPNFNMMKGQAPFDLAKVQAGLKVYQDEAPKLKGLFPDDSKTGGDTDAPAKIWQAKPEFNAAIETFVSIAKTAASGIKDEATFKAQYPKVVASCGGCHKDADGFAPRLADSFKKLKQ